MFAAEAMRGKIRRS